MVASSNCANILLAVTPVKSRRTQEERTAATRRRILTAASELFVRDGYAAATMTAIAERAGVAVQTVYLVFRTKGELLTKVYTSAVLGDPVPTQPERTPGIVLATSTTDPEESIRLFVAECAEILRRTAPLEPVVRAAASTEESVRAFHARGESERIAGYRRFVASLDQRSFLRDGVGADEATDVLVSLVGPHMYRTLTADRGWTHQRYRDWTSDAVARLVTRARDVLDLVDDDEVSSMKGGSQRSRGGSTS